MSALTSHWICLIYFGDFFIIQCQILTGPNVCGNIINMFCCKDHYQMGNKCVECIGSTGMNCSQSCPMNYYGSKCLSKCVCSPDKYCDHVRGCLCNITTVNCTDEATVADATSVSTMSMNQFDAGSRSRKGYKVKILLPTLLIAIVLITVFTASGRHWYKYATERSTDSIVTEQSIQEDEQQQDNRNEKNNLTPIGIYSHLTFRIRSSFMSLYHTRRNFGAESSPSRFSDLSLPDPCQQKNEAIHVHDTDAEQRHVETVGEDTTIFESNLCGKDEPNEAFYSNTKHRMKNCFSYSDIHVIPCPPDALNLNERKLPRSVVEIRPDSPVVSEVSDDLYFDVSYATQSTLSGDKHHDNCCYPLSPSSENEVRLRTDNISLTKHSSCAEESKMEISSYLRSMPCADLCSKIGDKLHSSPNTRPESPVESMYLNASCFNLTNTSCERTEVLESSSSLCPSAFEDDILDYVNCSNWI